MECFCVVDDFVYIEESDRGENYFSDRLSIFYYCGCRRYFGVIERLDRRVR